MTTDQELAIDDAIKEGRMIDAIQLYRIATRASADSARDYVELRRRTLTPRAPQFPLILLWVPFFFLLAIAAALVAFITYDR